MSDREFTDGELELVIEALTGAILTLAGRSRQRGASFASTEFDFSGYSASETQFGFRDDDPRIDEQLTYAQNVLDRLQAERDRRRAITVQRICEWAEFGLPRSSQ
ncbi:hypothetical protein N1937_02085 [Rhizobium sp. WSM4643]|uniref:hypothetical protein n=1 Tax=Rhizobium sp. WSM4643 TaxID=3138253 RepID=UPI0021A89F76|nr:hypothetical protein [Rhizobium leguminosarum]UWM76062.1 hypothetical protein N1937_02085 [Rhizobium leguminosarum bv. viciae]